MSQPEAQSEQKPTKRVKRRISLTIARKYTSEWLSRPAVWLLAFVVAATAISLLNSPRTWQVSLLILAFTSLALVWPWVSIRGIRAHASFSRTRVIEGESSQLAIEITNYLPWPVWGIVVNERFRAPDGGPYQSKCFGVLAKIPAWSKSRQRVDFRSGVWGVYPRLDFQLSCGFPFGIWRVARTLPLQRGLLVRPRVFDLAASHAFDSNQTVHGERMSDRVGFDGEVVSLREYRTGDSLRQVHWAMTAKHDRIIVTEKQHATNTLVELVVLFPDSARPATSPDDDVLWLVRCVASVLRQFQDQQIVVRLKLERDLLRVGNGRREYEAAVDRLIERAIDYSAESCWADWPDETPRCRMILRAARLNRTVVEGDDANSIRAGDQVIDVVEAVAKAQMKGERRPTIEIETTGKPAEEFADRWRERLAGRDAIVRRARASQIRRGVSV